MTEAHWTTAGAEAAEQIGFDSDEPSWEPFTVEVEGIEFNAELHELHGPGVGVVMVTYEQGCRLCDEDGEETIVSAETIEDLI